MQASDGKAFRNLISGMSRMYGADPDELVLDAYWIALRDWDLDDLQAAASQLMKTAKFMPRPADFNGLKAAGEDSAGEAFANIRQWLEYTPNGYIIKPGTPPKLQSCIRILGGANAIAMCDEEKLHFLEKRFCEHFDEIGDRMQTREALPQIAFGSPSNDRPLIAGTFKSFSK